MKRAYDVLDKEADRLGCKTIDPNDYWEMKHPGQKVSRYAWSELLKETLVMKPDGVAYVCAEEMIEFVPPSVLMIKKEVFGGAKVTDMKPKDTVPDDPIPF